MNTEYDPYNTRSFADGENLGPDSTASRFSDTAENLFTWTELEHPVWTQILDDFFLNFLSINESDISEDKRPVDYFDGKVLDIACGNGRLTDVLVKSGIPQNSIVGVDFNSKLLGEAKDRFPDATFVKADMEALPFGTSEFALAVCHMGLEFNPNYKLMNFFHSVSRVLENGATLAVITTHPLEMVVESDLSSYGKYRAIPVESRWGTIINYHRSTADLLNMSTTHFQLDWMRELTIPDSARDKDPVQWAKYSNRGPIRLGLTLINSK